MLPIALLNMNSRGCRAASAAGLHMVTQTATSRTPTRQAVLHLVALCYLGVLRVQGADYSIGAWCHLQHTKLRVGARSHCLGRAYTSVHSISMWRHLTVALHSILQALKPESHQAETAIVEPTYTSRACL